MPISAFAHVPPALARTPVFNDAGFGGYLIFNDVRPYIDDRTGLYSKKFFDRYADLIKPDRPELSATFAKYHVRWTILGASNPAVGAMDSMAGWHRLYADQYAVVHVKDGAP